MAQYDSSTQSTSNRNSRKFKDIDLDFGRNVVTNDVNTVTDVIAIKRSVKNLIQTNFYERPFHPELGCGVRELLFENFTPITGVFIKRKIAEVLGNYEPRVTLNSIRLDDDQDNNRLVVDIYFYIVGIPGPQTVSTFLQRLR
jgi:phage baseplate assembly protein W